MKYTVDHYFAWWLQKYFNWCYKKVSMSLISSNFLNNVPDPSVLFKIYMPGVTHFCWIFESHKCRYRSIETYIMYDLLEISNQLESLGSWTINIHLTIHFTPMGVLTHRLCTLDRSLVPPSAWADIFRPRCLQSLKTLNKNKCPPGATRWEVLFSWVSKKNTGARGVVSGTHVCRVTFKHLPPARIRNITARIRNIPPGS